MMTTAHVPDPATDPFTDLPRDLPADLVAVDGPAVAALHERLVAAAVRDGLVDVAYTRLDSPVGPLLLAATRAGLVRVAFEAQDHDAVLTDLAARVSPRVLRVPARLDGAARQVEEYFAGRRHGFDLRLDLRLSHGFGVRVLECLGDIPFGSTRSYAEIAQAAGSPRAVRAVGSACARNPLPLVVPCHRVVRSDGTAGQYAGGAAAKRLLLELESQVTG